MTYQANVNQLIGCTIQTDENISAVILKTDGSVVQKVVDVSNKYFTKILELLKNKEYDEAIEYLLGKTPEVQAIQKQVGGEEGPVTVEYGVVKFDGVAIDNALTRRILRMIEEGFDVAPMKAFMTNLMQNPSYSAIEELYLFLEANNLSITPDGYFLAYKSVNENFSSIHDGKTDNTIGQTVSMPRNMVDDNREQTCSNGLHFASLDYCKHSFTGARILALKINPRDVVSIPSDYNNQKGRACEYFVIAEVTDEVKKQDRDPLSELAVADVGGFSVPKTKQEAKDSQFSWDAQVSLAQNLKAKAEQQIRDAKGRFIKKA